MASPLQYSKKIRWPSEKAKSSIGDKVSDFIPYVSNLANMFSRVPRPIAPRLIDPVINQKISMDQAKRQVESDSRAADMSTAGLDAHTGAAIRVGNLANKFRALSDINSREAMANTQINNQTNAVNASIDAQNTGMTNQYQDDLVNAQMAQNRLASENISNAADKYIGQQAVKDQMQLDKDKMNILSKMYNPGVYDRLIKSLNTAGVNTENMGGNPASVTPGFLKNLPAAPPLKTTNTPNSTTSNSMTPLNQPTDNQYYLPSFMRRGRQPKYLMEKFAAGGMMKTMSGDPVKPPVNNMPVKLFGENKRTDLAGSSLDDKMFAMNTPDTRMSVGMDLIHSVVNSGLLPNQTDQDRFMRDNIDPEMYSYLYQFNQRPDLKGMSADQRLQSFYSTFSNNPNIQAMKDNMKRYGYGPQEFNRNRAVGHVVPKTKFGTGGKMRKVFY